MYIPINFICLYSWYLSRFDSNNKGINLQTIGSVLTVGDGNTLAASRVLEQFGVTYVSPDAMSSTLDNLPHLARAVTPISGQMEELLKLLNAMGWSYVDTLFEESLDGDETWRSFLYYSKQQRLENLFFTRLVSFCSITNFIGTNSMPFY